MTGLMRRRDSTNRIGDLPEVCEGGRPSSPPLSSGSRRSRLLFEHNLSSILNNPHTSRSGDASWVGWWSSSTSVALPEFAPINTVRPELEINKSDFRPYLNVVSEQFNRFEDIQIHASKESVDSVLVNGIGGQGEALVACLREVPALYFKEDFQLEDGGTFRAACPFSTVAENLVLQERLSQYLDVVELHLVKEISLRSNSFFEAQRQLEDLNVKVVEGCTRIRELKDGVRLLDVDLVDSAMEIQRLSASRSNLLSVQKKMRLILYVNQALAALKLLVSSSDSAGALDIVDDLQNLLDGDELTGLHCFRHLQGHVESSIDAINSILSAEFMRASLHDTGDSDSMIFLREKEKACTPSNGRVDDDMLHVQETSNYRDLLLPVVIGLLRTAKLPSVLRFYRDTLTVDMKTAIKTAVAELLPVLVVRPQESDFSTGDRTVDSDGGGSLASRLRSLSSESFVELLASIFCIVLAHLVRAAEVKKSIEWIMSNLEGHYAAASVSAAIAHGAAAADRTSDGDAQTSSQLSLQISSCGVPSLQGSANETISNISLNFRADVLRENAEAVFAACDVAHGRWAKLLGVRALLHPRLRLQDFLSIHNTTQEFITTTEKIGGRLGYSIRGTLQSQAKAFIDYQHESRMAKIKAVLDQETWVEVDVPDEFQAIVISFFGSDPLFTSNSDGIYNKVPVVDGDSVSIRDGSSGDSREGNTHQNGEEMPIKKASAEIAVHETIHPSVETVNNSKADSIRSSNNNVKDRKPTSHTLQHRGSGYHMMLSEYIDMNNSLPALSSEVIHRVVEILKFFNTRTCQLVLGAGAMQVSGLKSITSKHLALASQVISFTYAIIPDIRQTLFLKVPETRKLLLMSEIDRVAQDYKIHRDEIHTKLVQIMRERLLFHLRGLPQIVEGWNRSEDNDTQPSQFARSLTKEVGFLQRVLSRTLHEADVQAIFRQVVIIFHTQISESFLHLEFTPQAKSRLQRDVDHILGCIRSLPSDIASKDGVRNWGPLDEFFAQRFSTEDSCSLVRNHISM
ncbi:hypothetical protein V2J09_013344 [Rumex salicifolius]